MALFEGAGVALVTPFKENGEVNYSKLEQILEDQIAGGTDSIIIVGTTGASGSDSVYGGGGEGPDTGDCRHWLQLYGNSGIFIRRGSGCGSGRMPDRDSLL